MLQTANQAYKTYNWLNQRYEASKWRPISLSEAEEVLGLMKPNMPTGVTADLWPTRDGQSYIVVSDRRESGFRTMGTAWDRWVEQRLSSWDDMASRAAAHGFRIDPEGLHGFTISHKRR